VKLTGVVKAVELQLVEGVQAYAGRESVFGGVTVSGTSAGPVWLLLYDQPVKVVDEIPGAVVPVPDQFPMKKFELLLADVIELTVTLILGLSGLMVPVKLISWSVT
jgi:hypothetical protein